VWLSAKGFPDPPPFRPGVHKAESPTLRQVLRFTSEEKENEFDRIVHEALSNGWGVGQSLYIQLGLCTNLNEWVDQELQEVIKEWNLIQQFNLSPAPSLPEADAERLDMYSIISDEIIKCQQKK